METYNFTLTDLLRFFPTKEDAIRMERLIISRYQQDIDQLDTLEYNFHWFTQSVLNASINNQKVNELLDKFKLDLVSTLENQINECEVKIKYIESL